MGVISLPNRSEPTPAQVSEDLRSLVSQVERVLLSDVSIGTSSTPIAHGLGRTPRAAIVVPRSDARVWRAAAPDDRCVYLAASSAVVADVEVIR